MKGCAAAIGMFDGVHLGHQALLEEVKDFAHESHLIPSVVTFQEHPLLTIAPQRAPLYITPPVEKNRLLKKAGIENVINLSFTQSIRSLSAREFMLMLKKEHNVSALFIGFNHRFGHNRIEGFQDYLIIGQEIGMQVFPSSKKVANVLGLPISSSLIRQSLQEGKIDISNAMLGRYFTIKGHVKEGQKIGRTIGYPTANLVPECTRQIIPATSAYACIALFNGKEWPAMVNIGNRPTIGDNLERTIEAHLIGFEGDLYESSLALAFVQRLRDEQKFSSLPELKQQLEADKASTLALITRR